jgi:copper chaperone CopZ
MKSFAQISKAEIIATGLTCSMCSNAINKQLKTLPEVVTVETDLNTNTFTVTLKEGNDLSPKYLRKSGKAGFFGSLVVTSKSETITKSAYILVNDKLSNAVKYNLKYLTKDL